MQSVYILQLDLLSAQLERIKNYELNVHFNELMNRIENGYYKFNSNDNRDMNMAIHFYVKFQKIICDLDSTHAHNQKCKYKVSHFWYTQLIYSTKMFIDECNKLNDDYKQWCNN